jgi:hypothetical protein
MTSPFSAVSRTPASVQLEVMKASAVRVLVPFGDLQKNICFALIADVVNAQLDCM